MFSKDGLLGLGFNLSNIAQMSYSDGQTLTLSRWHAPRASGTIELDNYNSLTLTIDLNKLLVPTPPIYNSIWR